jgi:hypothetical protein
MDRPADSERIGWWCGIVSSLLIVAGFFAIDEGGSEGPDAPIEVLVGEIVNNRGRIAVGSFVGMIGALVLVGFAVALRLRLARAGSRGEALGLVAYSFGLVMTVGGLAHGSFRLSTISAQDPAALAGAMPTIAILGQHVSDLLFWGAIGLVATIGLGSVGLLPKAVGWVGAAVAVATLALSPTDHGGVGLLLFAWIIAACVFLILGPESTVAVKGHSPVSGPGGDGE